MEGRRSVRQSGRVARRFHQSAVHIGNWADQHLTNNNYAALADGLDAELASLDSGPVALAPPPHTNRRRRRAGCPGLWCICMRRLVRDLLTSRSLPGATPQANDEAVTVVLRFLDDIHGRGDLGLRVVYEVRFLMRTPRHR